MFGRKFRRPRPKTVDACALRKVCGSAGPPLDHE